MNTQKTPRILRYLVGFGLLVAQLQAQSEAIIEVAPEPESITIWTMFQQGGWAIYALLAFSVAVVGLAVYCGILIREALYAT